MKLIKLNQGYETLVDDEDYEFLIKRKWQVCKGSHTIYVQACKGHTTIKMHRLLLNVIDPKLFVDHIDHNGLNNQRSNLRLCTRSQNNANRKSKKNGTSEYLGVSLRRNKIIQYKTVDGSIKTCISSACWVAQITYNNKRYKLGHFDTEIEAAKAYNEAAKKYHGEFANLNII